jgi:multidrug efflux system membrane fusion protein
MKIPSRVGPTVFFLALLAACDGGEKTNAEAPAVPAVTAIASARDVPVILQVIGRAEAYEGVTLKSRVDGQVSEVLFTDGQHVKKDDILIRLDPTDFIAHLKQAEAATAREQAVLAQGRTDTARYTALREKKFVSDEKLNEVRTGEATATANLRASRASEEIARIQLSYTAIRAPFPGVVGARLVFPGSFVKVGDTDLAVVNRVSPLLVSFSLPEKHLAQIRQAMSSGKIKVQINLPENDAVSFEGEVYFIDNAVDATTGTILMKAILPNQDEKLTPGQFLNVRLLLDTLIDTAVIPNEAVQQGAEGNFVFVVGKDDRVEMRKIDIGASHDGHTAVTKGIRSGETVVTDGHLRLAPGVRIRVDKRAPPPEEAPPSAT